MQSDGAALQGGYERRRDAVPVFFGALLFGGIEALIPQVAARGHPRARILHVDDSVPSPLSLLWSGKAFAAK